MLSYWYLCSLATPIVALLIFKLCTLTDIVSLLGLLTTNMLLNYTALKKRGVSIV